MSQVVFAAVAVLCFAGALLVVLLDGAERVVLLAVLAGLTAQAIPHLAHLTDPARR